MIDKSKIIKAIKKTDDEFVLTAMDQLLQNENNIPYWHIETLQQRLTDIEKGNTVFHNWEEARKSIFTFK